MAPPEAAKCIPDIGLKTVTSLAPEIAAGSGSRTVGSAARATPENSGFRMDLSLARSKAASSASTKDASTARIPRSHGLISTGWARLEVGLELQDWSPRGIRVLSPVSDDQRLPAEPISLALPFIYR